MSDRFLHTVVMMSIPIVIFFYKAVYYILTKNSSKSGDYKIQIKNSFQDMKMLMVLNMTLISFIHLSLFVEIIHFNSKNSLVFYTPALLEGLMYGILPIIADLLISSTKNVKFHKLITYVGVFLRLGLYAKSIFSKDSKIEVKLENKLPNIEYRKTVDISPTVNNIQEDVIKPKTLKKDITEVNNTSQVDSRYFSTKNTKDKFDYIKTVDLKNKDPK